METKTQQPPGNVQVIPDLNNPSEACTDSQTGLADLSNGDWQEEIYQMIKSLKDQYFAELRELYNKLSLKLLQVESFAPQKPSGQCERMKEFKIFLERILQVLQISKETVQPALRDKLPHYERQIISILNSQRRPDSTAQTGHAGAGDWQEEIYQMIKSLKDQYFGELSELFNKLSVKLQHVESFIPPQTPSEQLERMKTFKNMLERILQILQTSKCSVQPSLRDKLPQYEKQIISILNSQRQPVHPPVFACNCMK